MHDAIWIMGKVQLAKTLADQQVEEIILFLKSLTGQIPDDALKVPTVTAKRIGTRVMQFLSGISSSR